jgi:hypothetical protein
MILFLVLGAVWVGAAYVMLLGAVSVWVGVIHMHRQGFWMPVVVGLLTIGATLRLAFPLTSVMRTACSGKGEDEGLGLAE